MPLALPHWPFSGGLHLEEEQFASPLVPEPRQVQVYVDPDKLAEVGTPREHIAAGSDGAPSKVLPLAGPQAPARPVAFA